MCTFLSLKFTTGKMLDMGFIKKRTHRIENECLSFSITLFSIFSECWKMLHRKVSFCSLVSEYVYVCKTIREFCVESGIFVFKYKREQQKWNREPARTERKVRMLCGKNRIMKCQGIIRWLYENKEKQKRKEKKLSHEREANLT